MHELTAQIQQMPALGWIPLVLLLLLGLVLWAAGRRTLRTGFAAGGLLTGVVVGSVLSHIEVVADVGVPSWVVALAAAVIFALIAAALYRVVLAASIGVLLGALAGLSVLAADHLQVLPFGAGGDAGAQSTLHSDPPSSGDTTDDLNEWLDDVFAKDQPTPPPPAPSADATGAEATVAWIDWIRRMGAAAVAAPGAVWAQCPQRLRWVLGAATAVGALLGLVFGAAAPGFAASIVTALGGSLLVLSTGWIMAVRLGVEQGPVVDASPVTSLSVWMIAAVIGLGLQWMLKARSADKAAS